MKKINKKNIIIILGSILFIIIVSMFFLKVEITGDEEIVGQEEISKEQLRYTNLNIFYINKETQEIEKKEIKMDVKILMENTYDIILELILFPEDNKYEKLIDKKNIEKINLNGEVLEIAVSQDFYEMCNNEKKEKINKCIEMTFVQLIEINSINIIIKNN